MEAVVANRDLGATLKVKMRVLLDVLLDLLV